MMRIVYFAHDIHDGAVRKRAHALLRAGHEVTGLMMRRGPLAETDWDNIDLGRSYNGRHGQRLVGLWRGIRIARQHADLLARADIVIARNFDLLFCAVTACRLSGVTTPIVYECLDVHHYLTGHGAFGQAMRRVERSLLERVSLLAVSSPAFERDYYRRYHAGHYTSYLLENRLDGQSLPPRPAAPVLRQEGAPLRIGWFGNLRCDRSLGLMTGIARRFEGRVQVRLAGRPLPRYEGIIHDTPYMDYSGAYVSPDDLAGLYGGVDLIWAGDFWQPDFNSAALLPNRLYEGGYFGVPALGPADSETGRWIERHGTGFGVPEPLEEAMSTVIADLLSAPDRIAQTSRHVLSLPAALFAEPPGALDEMLDAALGKSSLREDAA